MIELARCPNPKCRNQENVQKVSDIVRHGTWQEHMYWGTLVTRQTDLAAELTMPDPPSTGPGPLVLGIAIFLGMFGVGGLIESVFDPSFRSEYGLEGIVVTLVLLGMSGALLLYRRANIRRRQAQLALWKEAQAMWNISLYYCFSCGSVFNLAKPDLFVPAKYLGECITELLR